MKKLLLITFFFSILQTSIAQITKDNWLVGGAAFYSSTWHNSALTSTNLRLNQISINPNLGYFLVNKFAAGLQLGYNLDYYKYDKEVGIGNWKSHTYSIGPFLRYYILPAEKQYNLLIEGNYQLGIERYGNSSSNVEPNYYYTEHKKNVFSISAGPVIYFNSSVGLEFLIAYSTSKYKDYKGSNNTLQFGMGLQVHLEKEK